MIRGSLTIVELCALLAVSHADVTATATAYLADPTKASYPLATGYTVDVAGAVEASPFAMLILRDPLSGWVLRRTVVRSALLQAKPTALMPSIPN